MSYTPSVNADTLVLYLGICATGRATASSTTLDMVSFGTLYNPLPSVTFDPSDVGMPIAIVGGGPVDPAMPSVNYIQGALFHTTIATYVSPTEVTLTDAPDTSIFNTGFATVILYRPCPFASDQANVPTAFTFKSSIAAGTNDTLEFSVLNSLGGDLGVDNPYIDRFGAIQLGQPVYLKSTDSSVGDIFGGYIDTLTVSSQPGVPGTPYCWSAQCSSWSGLARRRVVPPATPQTFDTTGDAVFKALVFDYLVDDGVSVTAASAPTISLAAAVGVNIGQLLDQVVSLCSTDVTAWYWTVDAWRNFILATRTGNAAPWNVTDGSDLFAGDTPYQQSIVTSHNQQANTSYAIGSNTLVNTLNVTLQGNGTATTFNLPAPAGAAPTITLNAVAQSVGVLGVDSGDQWYWAQGSAVITQDTGGTVLGPTDVLLVTYSPLVPAVAQSFDVASLQQQQAIEGTSATYSHVSTVTQPILPADLLAIATAYELEYGQPAATCQLYTLRPGLATGQLQSIALPDAGIPSGEYLIATVQMTTFNNVILWQYTAFGGANIGDSITALTQFINRELNGTVAITTPTVPIQAVTAVPTQSTVGEPLGGPVSWPGPVTKGNLLVVVCIRGGLDNPPPISDTLGNTWIQAIYFQETHSFPNEISIMYAFANATGTDAVSCGGSGGAQWICMMEFSGVAETSTVDATAGTFGTSPPTLTTTSNGDLIVSGCTGVLANPPTVTAPEVLAGFADDFVQPGIAASYVTQAAAGSFTTSLNPGAYARTTWASAAFRVSQPTQTVTDVLGNPQGTVSHATGALTSGEPIVGNGGGDIKAGTKTGTTTEFVSASAVGTTGQPVLWDASGNADAGAVGQLVPSGGSTGEVLGKLSGTSYDTGWVASANSTHAEPLTDGNSNFIFADGDCIVVIGVPN